MSNSLLNKKAFSLIELSVVILIIGILVAGVTQSSRLVRQMRLSSARSITNSSSVSTIKDLAIWYDTTSEKSFDESESSDATQITNWYDLNPQISPSTRINAVGSGATRPVYSSEGINGLPALVFDGGDVLSSTGAPSLLESGSATFFFVINPNSISSQRFILMQAFANCATNIEIGHSTGNGGQGNFGIHSGCSKANVSPTNTLANLESSIISMVMLPSPLTSGVTSNTLIYKNGTSLTLSADASGYNSNLGGAYAKSNSTLFIGTRNGADAYYSGKIGEIIVFSRSLKDEERKSVEQYLGRKWGIKVS